MKRIVIKPLSSSFHKTFNKKNNLVLPRLTSSRLMSSNPDEKKDVGIAGKFKQMWKKYGYLFVGTYASVYVTTLGALFISLDQDILQAATFGLDAETSVIKFCDMVETLTGSKDFPGYIRENPRVGTFAIAWIMTKFTEPLRLGVTVVALPQIAKKLGIGKKDQENSGSK